MNRLNTVLLAFFLISSFAWAEEKPDAPKPKTDRVMDLRYFAVLGVLAAAKAADGFTTSEASWPGCRETNPILGPHPSNARLAGLAAASFGVEAGTAFLLKRFGRSHKWARFLWLGEPLFQSLRHAQAALHDANLNCRGTP
jgi:hypothetical protein